MEADGIVDPLPRRTLIKANLRENIASQLIGGFWKKGIRTYKYIRVRNLQLVLRTAAESLAGTPYCHVRQELADELACSTNQKELADYLITKLIVILQSICHGK